MYGAEYILDLLLLYKKHKGKKMTVPVRRHAYFLQQTFSKIQFVEHASWTQRNWPTKSIRNPDPCLFLSNSLKKLVPFQLSGSKNEHKEPKERKINILIPLSGRFDMFVRFYGNFWEDMPHSESERQFRCSAFQFWLQPWQGQASWTHERLPHKYPKADMQILPVSENFQALEVDRSV